MELIENTTVDFLMKYYRLLQCFPAWFFFPFIFFIMIFSKIIFVDFFFNIKLVENLTL